MATATGATTNNLTVGSGGNGTLLINGGGTVTSGTGSIGDKAGSNGTVTVSGGTWINHDNFYSGQLTVGGSGTGTLIINGGGTVTSDNGIIGNAAGSTGTVTVNNGSWTTDVDFLLVGNAGTGTLNINSGGTVTTLMAFIGNAAGSNGTVTVSGGTLINNGQLTVGGSGNGTLIINGGGTVNSVMTSIGAYAGSNGTVTVSDGTWINDASFSVGRSGTLNITGGGSVTEYGVIELAGTLNLGASGTTAGTLNTDIVFGHAGTANFLESGVYTFAVPLWGALSVNQNGAGTTILTGSSNFNGNTTINSGTLQIASGGSVTNDQGIIGSAAGSNGTVTVSGGTWNNHDNFYNGQLTVGGSGNGTLIINGGGTVTSDIGIIGNAAGSNGTVTINNGSWTNNFDVLLVGNTGAGTLNINSGGTVNSLMAFIGNAAGSNGTVTISDGTLICNDELKVGYSGTGTLIITGSGTVNSTQTYIGNAAGSNGTVTVSGGTLINYVSFDVGGSGTGTLNITGGGSVTEYGGIELAGGPGSIGTLNLGASGTSAGTLNADRVIGLKGTATVNFLESGVYTFAPQLTGNLSVNQSGAGTTILTGSSNFNGNTTINSGTLQIASGGSVTNDQGIIGSAAGSNGTVTVSGGTWNNHDNFYNGQLTVGGSGNGTLIINGGGTVTSDIGIIGNAAGSNGTVTINNGSWTNNFDVLLVGNTGAGTLNINSGGTVNSLMAFIGNAAGSNGTVTISDGTLICNDELKVGYSGTGTLIITGSGTVNSTQTYIGNAAGSNGTVTVSGGTLINYVSFDVGGSGTGTLNITGGGSVTEYGGIELAGGPGSIGTLNLGASGTSAGTLNADRVIGLKGTATVNFLESGVYTFAPQLTGNLSVNQSGAGTTILTGSNTYIGITTLGVGTLNLGVAEISGTSGPLGKSVVNNPGSIVLNGGYLQYSAVNQFDYSGRFSTAANQQYNVDTNGQNVTWATPLTSPGGSLSKAGDGTLTLPGGDTLASFNVNEGTLMLTGGAFTGTAGIVNNAVISVGANSSAYGGGSGFDNEGEIDIANGTVGGASMLNNGLISGYGAINGANFTNYGLVTQGAGNITLSAIGLNQNFGNIALAAGRQFRLTGSALLNEGTLNLNSGIVAGTTLLDNSAGGVITGPGSILTPFSNDLGATVQVDAGTLYISQSFTNTGLISLTGASANLTGAGLTNNGTIQGVGNVGSTTLMNNGTIEAIGGTLGINGALTNPAGGAIFSGTGAKVLVSQGLAANAGLINLSGGTFDNNNKPLTNTGQISGYGIFRSGGLTNSGSATFTGGQTTVNGNVSNASGGTITVTQNPATFTGNVTNNPGGTIKILHTTVTWAGTFTDNGNEITDPSTQNFTDLVFGSTGSIAGSVGDVYNVSGNLVNNSAQNTAFDISQVKLTLQGTVTHQFTWPGADLGAIASGYTNNFSIGTLELQAGGSITILDGNATSGVGIYVETLELDGGLSQISSITGNGANIYYDPAQTGNAYLNDGTYSLQGGGSISPVPEPSTWAMLVGGFGSLLVLRKRRRKIESASFPCIL